MIRHKLIKMMVAVGLILATTVTTAFAVTYGWEQRGNDWYYMQYDNQYAKGVSSISGKVYQFNDSGKLLGDYKEPVVSNTLANYKAPATTKSVARTSTNENIQLNDELSNLTSTENTVQLSEEEFYNTVCDKMFKLVNTHRIKNGITKLELSDKLNNSAKLKSQHMVDNNYYSHDWGGLDCQALNYKISGITGIGENIHCISAIYNGTEERAESIANKLFTDWKNSPGHDANMLNTNVNNFGFGFAFGKHNGTDSVYAVQHFQY